MHRRDISFLNPQENIAYDQVLWRMAEKNNTGEYIRFWESSKIFIVMGLTGQIAFDVHEIQAREDKIPVLRRSSGGGTVLQGPGCLNYTFILSKQKHPQVNDLRGSYEWISQKIVGALHKAGVESYFRPISDLATGPDEKKFSGNAQRRGKNYILHHGTVLYGFDLSLISRYLKMPKDIPEYRKARPHTDFVTNIPLDAPMFKDYLAQAFGAEASQPPSAQELSLLKNC